MWYMLLCGASDNHVSAGMIRRFPVPFQVSLDSRDWLCRLKMLIESGMSREGRPASSWRPHCTRYQTSEIKQPGDNPLRTVLKP